MSGKKLTAVVFAAVAFAGCRGSGFCSTHHCIGDWDGEAAKGGTIVQCADGPWSHAGGFSGACSDHGD